MSKLDEGEFITYYGKLNEWRLYRATDGTVIGYKSKFDKDGEKIGVERIVTTTTDPEKFGEYVDKHEPKAKRYNPYKDEAQQRIPTPGVDE